ncbi:hypothetical protein E5Q_06028 [Mixia osmundae IAM 14324]|uniref:Protein ROT1 n=2 Tax=Mixia osmundae (strain CBS 9802 / IAM 14324 / JCM 22182 / KY 12970) TaxID=764103 RepID=G7E9L4_MIXOS|nr:hypothetical protein E5Q_06028 [Mixia osmundae IAM 14324]
MSSLLMALLVLIAASQPARAQHNAADNITSLAGTWSSGSGNVITGPGFANPVNFSFAYPATTGIAYSFTDDGHFEEAQYRFDANGTEPHCVKAFFIFQHGTYEFQPNGSITTLPIAADGRIQVQDPCAAESSVITYYYEPAIFQSWLIYNDQNHNAYGLQLSAFDGSLLPRLFLKYTPPAMWPTTQLTTNRSTVQTNEANAKRDLVQQSLLQAELVKRGSATSSSPSTVGIQAAGLLGLLSLGFVLVR